MWMDIFEFLVSPGGTSQSARRVSLEPMVTTSGIQLITSPALWMVVITVYSWCIGARQEVQYILLLVMAHGWSLTILQAVAQIMDTSMEIIAYSHYSKVLIPAISIMWLTVFIFISLESSHKRYQKVVLHFCWFYLWSSFCGRFSSYCNSVE